MNILIAGGSGFLGKALVAFFLKQGHSIAVLSRSPLKVKNLFSNSVTCISWQELNLTHLKRFNAIINLSGANIGEGRWSHKKRQEIVDSRVRTTQILANLCSQLGTTSPRLLNASAIGVYDFSKISNQPIEFYNEYSKINFNEFPTFLAYVARQWELATTVASKQGVNVVNLRFGVILSRQGGALKKLLPSFKLGLGAQIGCGQQAFSWISLQDAIHAIDFILTTPSISGPVNLVSPYPVTQQEFANTLAKNLHTPRLVTLPALAVKILFGEMGNELLLNGFWVKPTKLLEHGFKFEKPNLYEAL